MIWDEYLHEWLEMVRDLLQWVKRNAAEKKKNCQQNRHMTITEKYPIAFWEKNTK